MLSEVTAWCAAHEELSVAVSGGIDSLVLAAIAHNATRARLFHAASPAVPHEAGERLRRYAAQFSWNLTFLDSPEMEDERYLANPLERCYFCKFNLYDAIRRKDAALIISGANADDLGDFRPGLRAAEEAGVRHPFIELNIGKRGIRELAPQVGLGEIQEIPSSPCLSSRVETGIAIRPTLLRTIDAAEQALRAKFPNQNLRCRWMNQGIVIELEPAPLTALSAAERAEITAIVAPLFASSGETASVNFRAYRMGGGRTA